MASAIGDLVAIAGLDSTKWVQGCIDIQNATNKTTTNIQQNFGGTGSAALGRGISQMGFALQDFTSVLEGGGKNALGRALMSTMNNVQMLGAAFGPWGMAITAVGGAIGAMLIPKLLEGQQAFEDLSSAAERSLTSLEAFNRRTTELGNFREKVGKIESEKGADEATKALEVDMAATKARGEAITAEIARQMKAIADAKKMRSDLIKPSDSLLGTAADWVMSPAKSFTAMELDSQIKQMNETLEKTRKLYRDIGVEIGVDTAKMDILKEAINSGAVEDAERKKRNEAELKKDEDAAQKFKDAGRTPIEAAQDKINEITRLAKSGFFGADMTGAVKAAEDVQRDLGRSLGGGRALGGTELGTSAGFSAIQAALRQDRGGPEVDILKQQLEELRRISRTTTSTTTTVVKEEGIN